MDLTSASHVALSLRIVGRKAKAEWNTVEDTPDAVEGLREICSRYYNQINSAIADEEGLEALVRQLLFDLEDLRDYDNEGVVSDEAAMLLDAVRLSLIVNLSTSDFIRD